MLRKNTGIYIHIPYCKSKCSYCDFVSFTSFSTQKIYLEKLKDEIRTRADGSTCDTIYIGGGTPSVFLNGGISEIADTLRKNFTILQDAEFTVEANPESCSEAFLTECRASGATRLSLGLQSCSDAILKSAGRRHDYSDFYRAFVSARRAGFENISADLILGFDGETEEGVCQSVRSLIGLGVEHVSVYALKCEPDTPLYKKGFVPDDDFIAALYDIAVHELAVAGYLRYEVSNFAKKGFESRHNIKYWTLAPYFGFGVAAHSYINKTRQANTTELVKYLDGLFLEEQTLSEEKTEFLMLGLRMRDGISLREYENTFNENILIELKNKIERLISDKVLLINGDRLSINEKYLYVMNQIIVQLLE